MISQGQHTREIIPSRAQMIPEKCKDFPGLSKEYTDSFSNFDYLI